MNKYVKSDLFRYTGRYSKKELLKLLVFNPCFKYTYILRHVRHHMIKNNRVRYFLWRVLQVRYTLKYGFEIGPRVELGEGFYMNHYPGITINPNVKIGINFTIYKGATIGSEFRGKRTGSPTIGDSVWVGANSTIVGKIHIGNNVMIAPNSFVNFNIPDDSIVIGNPARIIPNKNATDGYIVFKVVESV